MYQYDVPINFGLSHRFSPMQQPANRPFGQQFQGQQQPHRPPPLHSTGQLGPYGGYTPMPMFSPTPRPYKGEDGARRAEIENRFSAQQLGGEAERGVVCCLCGRGEESRELLESHLAEAHLDWTPFVCRVCRFVRLPSEHALRQHHEQAHPDEELVVIYKLDDTKRESLARLMEESLKIDCQTPATPARSDQPRSSSWDTGAQSPFGGIGNIETNPIFKHSMDGDLLDPERVSLAPVTPSLTPMYSRQSTGHSSEQSAQSPEAPAPQPPSGMMSPARPIKLESPQPTVVTNISGSPQVVDLSDDSDGDVQPTSPTQNSETSRKDSQSQGKSPQPTSANAKEVSPVVNRASQVQTRMDQFLQQPPKQDTHELADRRSGEKEFCQLCLVDVSAVGKDTHVWQNHLGLTVVDPAFQKQADRLLSRCFKTSATDSAENLGNKTSKGKENRKRSSSPAPQQVKKAPKQKNDAENRVGISGEDYCSICCIAIGRSSRWYHVWLTHMPVQPVQCKLCSKPMLNRGEMNAHAASQHPNVDSQSITIDLKPVHRELYKKQYAMCFSSSWHASQGTPTAKKAKDLKRKQPSPEDGRQQCNLCDQKVGKSRERHVWVHHMSTKRFNCGYCEYGANSHSKMTTHTTKTHDSAELKLREQPESVDKEFEECLDKCFDEVSSDGDSERKRTRRDSAEEDPDYEPSFVKEENRSGSASPASEVQPFLVLNIVGTGSAESPISFDDQETEKEEETIE